MSEQQKSLELMLNTYKEIDLDELTAFCLKCHHNDLYTLRLTGGEQQYDIAGYETSQKELTLIATP
jgi:hypothetical protein